MKRFICGLISLALWGAALAQETPKIGTFGGNTNRSAARVLYFDPVKRALLGEFSIDYGLPKWKADYDDPAKFDSLTKGKAWRFGEGIWTTLDTNLPLKFGDRSVAPGIYYLGLRRGNDDKWSLEFYQPAKVHEKRLDAVAIANAKPDFGVPLTFSKTDKLAETLAVKLDYPKDNPTKVTLRIDWGKFELSTPIDVSLK